MRTRVADNGGDVGVGSWLEARDVSENEDEFPDAAQEPAEDGSQPEAVEDFGDVHHGQEQEHLRAVDGEEKGDLLGEAVHVQSLVHAGDGSLPCGGVERVWDEVAEAWCEDCKHDGRENAKQERNRDVPPVAEAAEQRHRLFEVKGK